MVRARLLTTLDLIRGEIFARSPDSRSWSTKPSTIESFCRHNLTRGTRTLCRSISFVVAKVHCFCGVDVRPTRSQNDRWPFSVTNLFIAHHQPLDRCLQSFHLLLFCSRPQRRLCRSPQKNVLLPEGRRFCRARAAAVGAVCSGGFFYDAQTAQGCSWPTVLNPANYGPV